jgi:hypothetical protein
MRTITSSLRFPLSLLFLCFLWLMMSGCAEVPSRPGVVFAPPGRNFLVVQADTLNMRKCPDQTCPVMALLYRGETVAMRKQSGDWSEIETKWGGIGWVASRYLGDAHLGAGGPASRQLAPPALPEEELAEPIPASPSEVFDEPAKSGTTSGRENTPPEISEEFGQ